MPSGGRRSSSTLRTSTSWAAPMPGSRTRALVTPLAPCPAVPFQPTLPLLPALSCCAVVSREARMYGCTKEKRQKGFGIISA